MAELTVRADPGHVYLERTQIQPPCAGWERAVCTGVLRRILEVGHTRGRLERNRARQRALQLNPS
jgi:hypothetical protein